LEKQFGTSLKAKNIRVLLRHSIPLLGVYPREIHTKSYTQMFMAALLLTVPNMKNTNVH
jgi:hypothetical protein